MKREEAMEFALNGKTPLIEDFVSRFGRNFKAFLKRRPNGRHEFEFPPREGGERKGRWGNRKKAAEKDEAVEGTAEPAQNGAPAKKATKKAPAKKAAKKTTAAKRPSKKA